MRQVARDVWLLHGFPANGFNVYLAGDVLIDAGTRWARSRILRQISGRKVSLMALTHVHPDHQGSAAAVCARYRVPVACHEADVPFMEGRAPMLPRNRILSLGGVAWAGPPLPVGRVLRDGDEVAGFRVVHTPGHTPGHIVFFRESDRVAIAGDLLTNMSFLTFGAGLRLTPWFFSADPLQNAVSVLTLHRLRPAVVCFGHGPPLFEPRLLDAFVARLERKLASHSSMERG
jgi:glyoxylase-like metal-dependent hydrolase (beta-lactamase superfamily II)